MSEPMDFTSPTHGRIYARTSRTLSIPEPGVQSQLLHQVIPPQISTSVPPNLYSANRRLQPLLSPSFISPTLSLPNILSPTPDNILHHQPIAQLAYRRLNNPHLHQPTLHDSPRLSYVTHHSALPPPAIAPVPHHHSVYPSPINAPVPRVPIPDLNQSHHTHSRAASLRPPRDCHGYEKPAGKCRGLAWGAGTGSVYLTLAKPVPPAGVGGLPRGFKLRSKM